MKIVYSTESITRNGGIQTVTIVKANALAEIDGNDVFIVVPHISGISPRHISPKVHVINLEIRDFWVSLFRQPARNRLYKKRLQKVLEQIGPDIVVSTGLYDRNFLPRIRVSSNPVFIREIHFVSTYRRLMAESPKERILAAWSEFLDYRLSINRYDRIMLLSEEDRVKNWPKNRKALYMPNPLTVSSTSESSLMVPKAIAVGRLCRQKHFDALIKAWRKVADRYPEWTLEIWGGNGPLFDTLKALIGELKLEQQVLLKGETQEISAKMADSSMIISTSIFEGMPLVLLEALSVGLPIVTFNYMYGAEELVTEGHNGFIVKQDYIDVLADRICRLISSPELRKRMGENAKTASQKFTPDVIAHRWMDLFRKLRLEKKDPRL